MKHTATLGSDSSLSGKSDSVLVICGGQVIRTMVTWKKINETEVSNIGKLSGTQSCIVRVPFSWLHKKIICKLAEEEKQTPDKPLESPEA